MVCTWEDSIFSFKYPGHSMIVFCISRISLYLSSSGVTKEFRAYFELQCWPSWIFPKPSSQSTENFAHKTLFGRHKQRWEGNIKIYLKEIGNKNVVWIHMAHDMVQWQTPSQSVRSQISIYFLCHFPQQLHIMQFICSAICVMPQRMWLTTAALWQVSSVRSRNSSTVHGSSGGRACKVTFCMLDRTSRMRFEYTSWTLQAQIFHITFMGNFCYTQILYLKENKIQDSNKILNCNNMLIFWHINLL